MDIKKIHNRHYEKKKEEKKEAVGKNLQLYDMYVLYWTKQYFIYRYI